MNLNTNFTVLARCKNLDDEYKITEDINLILDLDKASSFLMRFMPNKFSIDGYKVIFHYTSDSNIDYIILVKDNKHYSVTNINQLVTEIYKGYIKLLTLNKISSIMDFDFNQTNEENVEDEFS